MIQRMSVRFCLFALVLTLSGCLLNRADLVLVIPDDYAIGQTYVIALDKNEGSEPELADDGSVIFHYSESGNKYNSFDVFETWHRITIVTESGEVVKTEGATMQPIILSGRLANKAKIGRDSYVLGGCDESEGACSDSISEDDGVLMRIHILPVE